MGARCCLDPTASSISAWAMEAPRTIPRAEARTSQICWDPFSGWTFKVEHLTPYLATTLLWGRPAFSLRSGAMDCGIPGDSPSIGLTGDLYIADVGQEHYEEVDVAPGGANRRGKGINYGWNIMEGAHCLGGGQCDQTGLTLPTFEYAHDQGCSITGGYVYRGNAIPALQGLYFFGDYCQGWVRSIRYTGGQATEVTDWPTLRPAARSSASERMLRGSFTCSSSSGGVFKMFPTNRMHGQSGG